MKSTLTRSYKKASHLVPYATELVGGGKKRGKKRTEISLESREEDEANQLFGDDSEESSLEDEAEIQKMAKVVRYSFGKEVRCPWALRKQSQNLGGVLYLNAFVCRSRLQRQLRIMVRHQLVQGRRKSLRLEAEEGRRQNLYEDVK